MMDNNKKFWVVVVNNSAAERMFLAKFFGTKEQAVERLSEMMRADEEESEDEVLYIDEPDDKSEGIYGHISFLNHQIDYIANAIDDLGKV